MALSRQDVIITCVVAFLSWTVVSTLVPGLRWIPYAFVAGFLAAIGGVLFLVATASRSSSHTRYAAPAPRSSFLSFTSPKAWSSEVTALKDRSSYSPHRVYAASHIISDRIDAILRLIFRDFLSSWYGKLSTGVTFINEVDRAIRVALDVMITTVVSKDLVELGITKILPIINAHIKDFSEAERLVRGRNLTTDVTETEELDLAIATKYKDGRVHPAASLSATKTAATQQQHMRRMIGRLVSEILPDTMTTSSSVLVLVREVLACVIVVPVLQMVSDPDVINQLIEGYGRSLLYERKTVRKLRAALDEHATPAKTSNKASIMLSLHPNDGERAFERFIRAIRQLQSLPDARRSRSEILRQLKRHLAQGSDDETHLRRLETGKRALDQRIAQLLQAHPSPNNLFADHSKIVSDLPKREDASLRAVLYDASGLSYFMEFMDRLRIMSLVQFWIVVDGMRNPLDLDVAGAEQSQMWSDADRNDIVMINEAYIEKLDLNISKASQRSIREFVTAGSRATWNQYATARRAILAAQGDIYRDMERRHFPDFKKSDLYYKWVTSDATSAAADVGLNLDQRPHPQRPHAEVRRSSDNAPVTKVKESDLRRAIASTSDLHKSVRDIEKMSEHRRSLDGTRPPLFDDDKDEDDPLTQSVRSIDSEQDLRNRSDQMRIVEAVQAALDDIVDEGTDGDSILSSRDLMTPQEVDSPRDLFAMPSPGATSPDPGGQGRPSLSSLGLIGTPTRPTVFTKGDLFGESEKLWEDDGETTDNSQVQDQGEIREAAPGDLGLTELVQSLSLEINKLEAQQGIVDALTRKAELTNNAAELRILRKSKTSLEREIHRKELQRQQYLVQQSENDLYGRAAISIKRIIIGTEEDGHEFALYVIEVQRQTGEKALAVSWAVAKRYSEFHDLHKRLRARYPSIRELDFPRRQMVLTLQKEFLKKRRAALEKYLRDLLTRADVCRSIEFRAFLSQQAIRPISTNTTGDARRIDRQDFITRIYNSVTDGMEEFLGNVPVLDQLSLAGQNLISAATALPPAQSGAADHSATSTSFLPSAVFANDPTTAAEAEAEANALESTRYPETTTFITPICDTFVDVFQLHQGNSWLRGRAVVVVLQQLLGGTIERHVRDAFRTATSETSIVRYMNLLRDTLWPQGRWRQSPPVRSAAMKAKSKREAGLVLAALLPDSIGGVVGKGNAARAARTLLATVNNERLNQHLVYSILDEVVDALFGIRVVR